MRRRDFIKVMAASTGAWPVIARAQQAAMPVIGYLSVVAPEGSAHIVAAFRTGLSEVGFIEGQNVTIEFRWAHNDISRLPELASDLVRRRVAVIVTPAATHATLVAKAATTTIPILFSTGSDPVQVGLVASLNRPGGNVTGISGMNVEVSAKRLGLLHELLPNAARFAILVNPSNPSTERLIRDTQSAAISIGRQIKEFSASNNRDIEIAFEGIRQWRADALLVEPETLFINRRVQLATLAARYALPAIYPFREDVLAGGLMCYGPSVTNNARLLGTYTGRVLKGAKPSDLPILQATKFEFVVNLATAKALGLNVPPMLLARADEVIE
jgi:putative ABC transport system substrate-binding protein